MGTWVKRRGVSYGGLDGEGASVGVTFGRRIIAPHWLICSHSRPNWKGCRFLLRGESASALC